MSLKPDPSHPGRAEEHGERLPLIRQVQYLLEECRIVLPGLQVLFGFQLAVVFSDRFARVLDTMQQQLHLLAMGLVATAIGVIMTPAAYHRQAQPHRINAAFVRLSSWLLLASLPLLAAAICLEFYLVAQVLLQGATTAATAAAGLLAVFAALWFALPQFARWRLHRDRDRSQRM